MPHTLLHLTSIRLLEGEDNLHPLAREALKRRRGLALLGCVMVDLPHYDSMWRHLVMAQVGLEHFGNEWAARLHHDNPMRMGVELLRQRQMEHALGPLARLALGLGYFSHAALDSALHPVVHQLVQDHRERGHELKLHRRIEKYQAVFLHPRLAAVDLVEDREVWRLCDLTGAADLERALEHITISVREARAGGAPSLKQWTGWLSGLRAYGEHGRGYFWRAEGGQVDQAQARARYVDQVDLPGRFIKAQARALTWINRLAEVFEQGDADQAGFTTLMRQFPEADLDQAMDDQADANPAAELWRQRLRGYQWRVASAERQARDTSALGSAAAALPRAAQLAAGPPAAPADPPTPALPAPPHTPVEEVQDGFEEVPAESGAATAGEGELRPGGRAPR